MKIDAQKRGSSYFMDVFKIYIFLLKEYGRQGWWPVKVVKVKGKREKLRFENELAYGVSYSRLKKYKTPWRDPYFEIAVGAILTQSAAWKNVALAINNLYKAKALTPPKIFKMPSVKLEKFIRPAGYFRQKAKKLKLFSQWLVSEFGGNITRLKSYKLQVARSKLLAQWGIGPETADSIILYALNKPIFVVDEYTRRLCKKFGVEFKTYDEYQKFFEHSLPLLFKEGIRGGLPSFAAKKYPISNISISSPHYLVHLFREYHALIVASGKEKHEQIQI